MKEIGHILDEIIEDAKKNVGVATTATAVPLRSDPVFVCAQKADALQWQWRQPATLPAQLGVTDLCHILKNVNYELAQQQQRATLEQIELLSTHLDKTRAICQEVDQCPVETLYFYTQMLKRMGHLFNNSNVKYRSYYDGGDAAVPTSSAYLYEYVQAMLVLGGRLYNASQSLTGGEAKRDTLDQCVAVFDELRDCCAHILSEKYTESRRRRWQYVKSPTALSSGTGIDAHALAQKQTDALRQFVTRDVGGLAHLEAHATLMRVKQNEMRADLLEREMVHDLAAYNANIYDDLAPIMQAIIEGYAQIGELLVQRRDAESQLAVYAHHMQLYWKTRQQTLMAHSDFACYEAATEYAHMAYGRRALRRLEALGEFHPSERATTQSLYEAIHKRVTEDFASGVEQLPLEPIKSRQASVQAKPFKFYSDACWDSFASRLPALDAAFAALRQLRDTDAERRSLTNVLMSATPSPPSSGGVPLARASNEAKAEVLRDRQRTLQWLLKSRRSDGTIVLDAGRVEQWEEEVRRTMERNKMI